MFKLSNKKVDRSRTDMVENRPSRGLKILLIGESGVGKSRY
jgi:transcriptional regulator with AAA-type ATPase domain